MSDILGQMLNKLNSIDESLVKMEIILAKQEEQLAYHIKRTDLLEDTVESLTKELKPLQEDWLRARFLGKLLGFLAASVSVIYYLVKIWKGG